MSNATDCLLVGGPKGGEVWCLNRNHPSFPNDITVSLPGGSTVVYKPQPWYDDSGGNWYWIATTADSPVDDYDIALEIIVADFNPAWDLRNKPAPVVEEDSDE